LFLEVNSTHILHQIHPKDVVLIVETST
jgi:hypothetical protein